jgi:hypothetical protein
MDARIKSGHDEEEAAVPLLECRGRRRMMIANHSSNRTTVPESPDGPDLLEE